MAFAKALNLPISTKHGIEISNYLRYKKTTFAKNFLEEVIALKKAVPFITFNNNVGHKAGMSAGRYPQKAAKEFLSLVKSVEANAQMKGLNSSSLKITKLLANKASEPMTGGRHRRGTKRTHLEIEVKEIAGKKEKRIQKDKTETKPVEKEVKSQPQVEKVSEPVKEEVKEDISEKVVEEQPEVKEVVEVKEDPKEVVPEVKPETEVVKKEEPEQELVVKKEEVKDVINEEPVPELKPESKPQEEVKKPELLEESSPEDLLKRAQEKAAQLNKQEKVDKKTEKEVGEVENLFEQLKQKGSLRDKKGDKEQ